MSNTSIANPIEAASPRHSAIVKASAGVGKTYLLVTRLIRLLLLDVRPDAILAITFTRKAAAEMQSRLFERLYVLATTSHEELLVELRNIHVETDPSTINKARNLYENMMRSETQVKTSTFHAFCQEILRKFPLESNVPPGFELLDDEASYLATAWDALYETATLNPESDTAAALEALYELANGLTNSQNCLNSFIHQRSDWWAYTAGQKDAAQYASEKLLAELDIDLTVRPYASLFNASNKKNLERIAQLLAMHDTKTNLKYVDTLHQITMSEAFNDKQKREENKYTPWVEKLSAILFKKNGTPRFDKAMKSREKKMTEAGEDEFLGLCLSVCKSLNTAKKTARKQHYYYFNRAWYVAGEALLTHFQQLKRQQRLLDFTDLEWHTFNLLNNDDNALWVQYKLDQRIDHLLVDEFQDTNPTQWRLLLPVMQEFVTDTDRMRSVFLVGDEKQSIYSFRRADPKLFTTASDWLHENLNALSYPMDKSRRSASPIMNLLNRVFTSDAFKNTFPDFHVHSTFLKNTPGEIHLMPIIEPEEKKAEAVYFRNAVTTPLPPEDDTHYREGQQIAKKITELLSSNNFIDSHNGPTNISFNDIMLLIRSRKHLSAYESALREANIPYTSNNKGTLFECQEIQDLIALLEVLYTPYNNLSLASVLRSPIFSCSNNELLLLSEKKTNLEKHSWFETLTAPVNKEIWPTNLARAASFLSRWQSISGKLPIHDMLDKIFSDADIFNRYYASVAAHFRSRVKSNLTQFLSLALDIDSGRYPSLGRFIARLHSLIQNDASPDETSDNISGSIRILTIHGAKGLEAPIVFLADTAENNKSTKNSYQALVDWPEKDDKPSTFVICPKKENRIELVDNLLAEQSIKTAVEDANLLYVALTRARQYLFISGCGQGKQEKLGWYGLLQSNWPNDDESAIHYDAQPHTIEKPTPQMETFSAPDLFFSDIKASSNENEAPIIEDLLLDGVEDGEAQLRGTFIHRAIELLTHFNLASHVAIKRQLSAEFHINMDTPDFESYFNEANATVNFSGFSDFFDENKFEKAYNEVPIQVKSDNRLQHRVIDRLITKKNDIIIVDYKTRRLDNINELQASAKSYQAQMQGYAKAVASIWSDKRIKTIILFTHYLKSIEL